MQHQVSDPPPNAIPAFGRTTLLLGVAVLCLLVAAFSASGTFGYLWQQWQLPEFSHGVLIPLISGFLVWQRWRRLDVLAFTGSWNGVALVAAGWLVYFVGTVASITTLDTYALVLVINGIVLSLLGWRAFRTLLVPMLLLFLMNPIPQFLFNNMSAALQLLSSQLGVAVIRLAGISVYLEGNVIDLGNYRLQVVEACSGLQYLFPLLTLGIVTTCLLELRRWVAVVLALSTVPVTILMNSFRIGVVGVLVDRYGTSQAEGFLHDFEGWVIFMACLLILLLELLLLLRLTGDRRSLRDVVAFEWPEPRPKGTLYTTRALPRQAWVAAGLIALMVLPAFVTPRRAEVPPPRADFTTWPTQLDGWTGRRDRLEPLVLEWLKLDDYLLADYRRDDGSLVNLYMAYYASQRSGQAAHSPASCLPGGGWKMSEFGQRQLPASPGRQAPLTFNRVVIEQAGSRQLVYYWFQQRGRRLTNEYAVKGYLLVDALQRNRTDGALVRLVTPLAPQEPIAEADRRLLDMAVAVTNRLGAFVPD